MDALANLVFAEELGRSTYGGVAITVLVHTDMASVHVFHAGTRSAAGALDAGHHRRRGDHRGRHHRAGCRLRREGHPHHARRRDGGLRPQRHEALHHQRRPRRSLLRRRQDRRVGREPRRSRCSSSRRARRASASAARSTSTAGARPTPRSSSSTDCRIPAENLLGEEGQGFYSIMRNFQNERLVARRHGDRRGAGGDRADARLGAHAPAHSARRCGTSRRSASASRCSRRRSRPAASSSMPRAWRMARRATTAVREVSMVKAYLRRTRQRGHVRLRAVPRRHGLHAREPRSSAWRATPASSRSAAARPR